MAKIKCEHCRLSFDSEAMISENGKFFCCNGCKNVYGVLNSSGFSEFYQRLGKNSLSPVKSDDSVKQSIASLYADFVKSENGLNHIDLIIEGIHCSACIWLNEKALFELEGVIEANINAVTNKAHIVWDEEVVNLATILERINAIGYRAYAYDANLDDARMSAKRREFYAKILVGIFCVMNIMWIAIAQYWGYFNGMDAKVRDILNFAEFILASPVLFYTGSAFFSGARIAIKNKTPNMDLLVIAGASLAYIYSVYAMFSRVGEVYFDSVAMIITFVFVGKFLEVLSKKQASDSIDKLNLLSASEVCVKVGENLQQKNARDVGVGETIVLKAGDKALLDGLITKGEASFDMQSLTGESLPVTLGEGMAIKSGAICLDANVQYQSTQNFENSLLNKIAKMLENALLQKPKIEQIANEISSYFSFFILSIAGLAFLWHFYDSNFVNAIVIAISVIVIACPCALALATPVSTLSALGVGLKNGVIYKSSKLIETLAKCDTIVFDKTGTLSEAKLSVDKFIKFENLDEKIYRSLALCSKHPVSEAVAEFFKDFDAVELKNTKEIAAKGVKAEFGAEILLGGSAKFMQENGIDTKGQDGNYFVAKNGVLCGVFVMSSKLRRGVSENIAKLKKMSYKIYILSGDTKSNTKAVADVLDTEFKAQCLPDEKAMFIKELTQNKKGVIFVGDGINDAIAMSYAQVGICMGSGADVSLEQSDVVLLNDELASLVLNLKLARATFGKIKQNLIFSLCYNLITIPLAVCGYVIPLFAALSMSLSSLVVVLNSLSLKLKFKA
ncbi:MAG: cadmium-translocating P-type ATPase [Campylobacter sp.]|nr:cadmium-translocating P-type ATPase [Campylobacter sp.]